MSLCSALCALPPQRAPPAPVVHPPTTLLRLLFALPPPSRCRRSPALPSLPHTTASLPPCPACSPSTTHQKRRVTVMRNLPPVLPLFAPQPSLPPCPCCPLSLPHASVTCPHALPCVLPHHVALLLLLLSALPPPSCSCRSPALPSLPHTTTACPRALPCVLPHPDAPEAARYCKHNLPLALPLLAPWPSLCSPALSLLPGPLCPPTCAALSLCPMPQPHVPVPCALLHCDVPEAACNMLL